MRHGEGARQPPRRFLFITTATTTHNPFLFLPLFSPSTSSTTSQTPPSFLKPPPFFPFVDSYLS